MIAIARAHGVNADALDPSDYPVPEIKSGAAPEAPKAPEVPK